MKLIKKTTVLIIFFMVSSCSKEEPTVPDKKLPDAEVLKLTLKGDKTYATSINRLNITMNEEMHYINNFVVIEELLLSNGATANIKVGDTLLLPQKTFEIKVTASEPGITATYSLTLKRDEGLQITPNVNLEATSSYELQVSDVYFNGYKITNPWPNFFVQGYGDFNGDGYTDVLHATGIFASADFSPIKLLLGDGTGANPNFCECGADCFSDCNGFIEKTDAFPENFEGFQHPRKIITGDYNNDGKLDAFVIAHGIDAEPYPGEAQGLLINNGNGFDAAKLPGTVSFGHGGASADIDNDGDIDVFLASGPLFLINNGVGDFAIEHDMINELPFQWGWYTSELIDVNKDGFFDLIIAGHEHDGASTTIYWGNSYGKFFIEKSTSLPGVDYYRIVVDIDSEDIDGDGDRDIILSRVSSNEPGSPYSFYERYYIQIIENQNNNAFVDVTAERIPENEDYHWRHWLHLQDLDNDGDFDIYYVENDGPSQRAVKWLNNGKGLFIKGN